MKLVETRRKQDECHCPHPGLGPIQLHQFHGAIRENSQQEILRDMAYFSNDVVPEFELVNWARRKKEVKD
jgi:hypothetical protein